MSADNGIYILQTLDGYRVVHAQAIENIYWWETWTCCGNPVPGHDVVKGDFCLHCGHSLPTHELREEINPQAIADYFGKSNVLKTEQEAWAEAQQLYDEIMNDDFCPIVEYGVQFIKGMEYQEFPVHLIPEYEGLEEEEDFECPICSWTPFYGTCGGCGYERKNNE